MHNETQQAEIKRILQSSTDVRSLYERFLKAITGAANADLGIAWDCTNPPRPICQAYRSNGQPARLSISEQMHAKLLEDASKNSKAFIVRPQADEQADPSVDQPMLMFGPVCDRQGMKLVELVLPGSSSVELTRQVLRDLDYFCELAADFDASPLNSGEETADTRVAEQPSSQLTNRMQLTKSDLDQYAHRVHASLELDDTLRVVANEARRVLDCDRVSVAVRRGNKFRISAISGQPSVNSRSNTTNLLQRLATRALATEQTLWFPNEDSQTPPQIEKPLQEYLGFTQTRTLAIVPIFASASEDQEIDAKPTAKREVVAGIIVEHCNSLWAKEEIQPTLAPVCRHASDAIRNSLEHQSLFGYSIWKTLGKAKVVTAARNLPKTLGIAAAAVACIASLIFVPAPFTLHSEGVLLPTDRQKVFATVEGEVADIQVDHRALVDKDAALLTLKNDNLELQLKELEGEIATLDTRLNHEYLIHGQQTNRDDLSEQIMQSNSAAMEKQKKSLEEQVEMLREKHAKLTVVSPIAGEVITWNLEDRLAARPVKPGELLMEVANVEGPWEIELNLPERRVGHLLRELEKRRSSGNEEGLRVVYQPAAEPGVRFEGRILEIARSLQMNADKTQSMRVLVSIDTNDIDEIRQYRSGVAAKIYCGEKSLGYVWLHELFEFVQSKILFRIW